jgi:hypothetical protein
MNREPDRNGEDLDFLRDHLERLPRSREPRRDLWPEIEREIRAAEVIPGGFRRWRREILALAAVLTLFAAALATGRNRAGAPVDVAQDPAAEMGPAATDRAEADGGLEAFHAAAAQDVMARLDADNVDPATADVIRKNLEIIDGAVEEIRRALEADPANTGLNRMLAAEYHRRGALLRQAARLVEPI